MFLIDRFEWIECLNEYLKMMWIYNDNLLVVYFHFILLLLYIFKSSILFEENKLIANQSLLWKR